MDKIIENNNLTIFKVQEEERQRIARDLHDTSLQNLTHLIHKIELSSLYIDKDPIQAKLELSIVEKSLRKTIEEIRNIIYDLRPMSFDDLGLKNALLQLLSCINEDQKYQITYDIDNVSCETNDVIQMAIFRLVRESLNNIVKHADATKILFFCKKNNHIYVIDITDNGKGFRKEECHGTKHFGLSLMKETCDILNRAFEVESQPGNGTRIHIEIPLEN